jgi:hypothetical protein
VNTALSVALTQRGAGVPGAASRLHRRFACDLFEFAELHCETSESTRSRQNRSFSITGDLISCGKRLDMPRLVEVDGVFG